MVHPDADGPVVPDLLEVKRRMPRIRFHELERAIGKRANILGKGPVVKPILRRREVIQSFVVLP